MRSNNYCTVLKIDKTLSTDCVYRNQDLEVECLWHLLCKAPLTAEMLSPPLLDNPAMIRDKEQACITPKGKRGRLIDYTKCYFRPLASFNTESWRSYAQCPLHDPPAWIIWFASWQLRDYFGPGCSIKPSIPRVGDAESNGTQDRTMWCGS